MAQLVSDLSKIAREISEAASDALLQSTEDIYAISQDLVPVDKGDLKASGGTDITEIQDGLAIKTIVGYGNDEDVDYAGYVEHGTERSPAQPYLTPSFAEGEAIYEKRLSEAVEKRLNG